MGRHQGAFGYLLLLILTTAGPPLAAQAPAGDGFRVEVGVTPSRVTIGQPFRTALRVTAPPGVAIEYGQLAASDTTEAIAPVEMSGADGETAIYTLVAWIVSDSLSAWVPIVMTMPDGSRRVDSARLRLPEVYSVLPAGDTLVEPRPPKGLYTPPLFGGNWWWWLLLLLAALLAGAIGLAVLARARRVEAMPARIDPRVWALGELDASELRDHAMPEEVAELYRRVSHILRAYMRALDPENGLELTTTELLARMREGGFEAEAIARLDRLFAATDRVKFAGDRPSRGDALALLADARAWVAAYPPNPVEREKAA